MPDTKLGTQEPRDQVSANPVHLRAVISKNIAAVGYGHGDLYILFHDGALYKGVGVDPEDHMRLVTAKSVGGHFHAHIKPKYQVTKCPNTSEVVWPGWNIDAPHSASIDESGQPPADFSRADAIQEICDSLQALAEARVDAAKANAEYLIALEAAANSPEMKGLSERSERATELRDSLDDKVRSLGKQFHQATGEKKPVGDFIVVKAGTSVKYDPIEALDYARKNLPNLVELKVSKFETHARAVAATAPLPFVTIIPKPTVNIASDLSPIVEDETLRGRRCVVCGKDRMTAENIGGVVSCHSCRDAAPI
ncbi:MAG: KTSC domain-containing protein [Blastocatellia bacterium]